MEQSSIMQNTGAQQVVYENGQLRRVPTWPYINEGTTGNIGNQCYSNMSMYPNGQAGNYFPRCNSLNSMTGVAHGNINVTQPNLLAYPSLGTWHYIPAQFLNSQNSYGTQAPCTQAPGYQQQPFQAWNYNQYNYQPAAPIPYIPLQETMVFNREGKGEAAPKPQKIPLEKKPTSYNFNISPFHGSDSRHHINLDKQVKGPRLSYETSCRKTASAWEPGENSPGGKDKRESVEQISSMLFMPTHRPRTPKKKSRRGERKVQFTHKKPAKKKIRRNHSVEQVLKFSVKKLKEVPTGDGKSWERSPPTIPEKETLFKDLPSKLVPMGYSQTPPESSDDDFDEKEAENTAQTVVNSMAVKKPDGRAKSILELNMNYSSSACHKLVSAPTPSQNYTSEDTLEKLPRLSSFPQKFNVSAIQQVNKENRELETKQQPRTSLSAEQGVLSVKSDLASSKVLTPSTHKASSEITSPRSSCRSAGMKPPIPYTPSTENIKSKPTPTRTVLPFKRVGSCPALRLSEVNNVPLTIECTIKDDTWQTVRRPKSGNKTKIKFRTPTPKLLQTPPLSKPMLHSNESKNSRKRKKRKKIPASVCAKVEKNSPIIAPMEPPTQAPSNRKSMCNFVMDCLQRTFSFASSKEKIN